MTHRPTVDHTRRDVRQGLLSRLLSALARTVRWLLLSLVFSIVIEWIGMTWWWPDEGLDHSRTMLATELGYLQADFRRSLISDRPMAIARAMTDHVNQVRETLNRLIDPVTAWYATSGITARPGRTQDPSDSTVARYAQAAGQTVELFAVRVAILVLALPVFGLAGLVGLVEGLVARDLRRWGGGRESSFVYHWAKRTAIPFLVLAWVAYLAMPFSLHPTIIVLPCAAAFGLSLSITASTFKKYL
jgi:integrating conjugative element membrane protein (TIGR03747 family)